MSELYDECLNKYVKLLKDFEGYAKALKIISEHIEPHFGNETFLDGKSINGLVMEIKNELSSQFYSITKKGLTISDIKTLASDLHEMDVKRNRLHNQLKEYGQKIGYNENDVMGDIVFNYHDTSSPRLNKVGKQIIFNAGALLIRYNGGEYNFYQPMDPKAYCYDAFIKTREHAKKLLEEHEKEKDNYKPKYKGDILSILSNPATYHSHLYPKKTEEETEEIFKEIKDKNKDLPINFGFELAHSAHGKMVYAHNLKVETDKISKDIDLDRKLTNLLKDIRKRTDFDY